MVLKLCANPPPPPNKFFPKKKKKKIAFRIGDSWLDARFLAKKYYPPAVR